MAKFLKQPKTSKYKNVLRMYFYFQLMYLQILCSQNKENFEWVSTNSNDLNKLTNTHIVIGGNEVGQVLYIGRVFDEKSVVLGKIFKHSQSNRGIWVPSKGGEANYLSYDILTYNCKNQQEDLRPFF